MKTLLAVLALSVSLFAQADGTTSPKTDFPAEVLDVVDGISFPRTSLRTTGGEIKFVAGTTIAVVEKWAKTEDIARKRFFQALGEVLEIADESDFIQLARDYGYELYSGKTTSRKIDITGFYNDVNPPTLNNTVTRACSFSLGHLSSARAKLDDLLNLNWYNNSFQLDIEIAGINLLESFADVEIYIDRGDVTMVRGALKAVEGLFYLMRGFDFTMDLSSAGTALEAFIADCQDRGMDPLVAFDSSPFARLSVKNASDLRQAKTLLQSAVDDLKAGETLLKARSDSLNHLVGYPLDPTLGTVFDAVLAYKDALITCIDQLLSPVSIADATVAVKSLTLTYTGKPVSPVVGNATVNGSVMPYDLGGTTSATEPGTYEMTFVGYGRSTGTKTLTWQIVVPPPSVSEDEKADVREDGKGGYVVRPSADCSEVVVSIPVGLDAKQVTVELSPEVRSAKLNGAALRIVRALSSQRSADITSFLDIPGADAQGVVDLTRATVKAAIVQETLDVSKGASVSFGAKPSLTTANTREGLVYTLFEGTTLGGMGAGDSTVGTGSPWTPTLKVTGGASGFYTIRVTK